MKKLFTWIESFFLIELMKGLMVTLRYAFSPKITTQYPEEKIPKSVRFRGKHALRRYESGEERCIGCKLCEAVCPALAITIETEPREDGTRGTTRYDIDLFKCVYCGLCEEACPTDAIVQTDIDAYHFEKKGQQIMTKADLLALGEEKEADIKEMKSHDAEYR